MKQAIILFSILIFVATGCTEQVSEPNLVELNNQNMKIIPSNPASADNIKLVVFDDCTYNVLSDVTRNKMTIDIRKQFNSMMKWPCRMENDTIEIGKLPEGNYTVNYKLLDTSTQVTDPVFLSFSFLLKVSK